MNESVIDEGFIAFNHHTGYSVDLYWVHDLLLDKGVSLILTCSNVDSDMVHRRFMGSVDEAGSHSLIETYFHAGFHYFRPEMYCMLKRF